MKSIRLTSLLLSFGLAFTLGFHAPPALADDGPYTVDILPDTLDDSVVWGFTIKATGGAMESDCGSYDGSAALDFWATTANGTQVPANEKAILAFEPAPGASWSTKTFEIELNSGVGSTNGTYSNHLDLNVPGGYYSVYIKVDDKAVTDKQVLSIPVAIADPISWAQFDPVVSAPANGASIEVTGTLTYCGKPYASYLTVVPPEGVTVTEKEVLSDSDGRFSFHVNSAVAGTYSIAVYSHGGMGGIDFVKVIFDPPTYTESWSLSATTTRSAEDDGCLGSIQGELLVNYGLTVSGTGGPPDTNATIVLINGKDTLEYPISFGAVTSEAAFEGILTVPVSGGAWTITIDRKGEIVAGEKSVYVPTIVSDPGSAVLFDNTTPGVIESGEPIIVTGQASFCGNPYVGPVEIEEVPGLTITPMKFNTRDDGRVTFSVKAAYSGGFYIPVRTFGGLGGRSVAYVYFTHGDPPPPTPVAYWTLYGSAANPAVSDTCTGATDPGEIQLNYGVAVSGSSGSVDTDATIVLRGAQETIRTPITFGSVSAGSSVESSITIPVSAGAWLVTIEQNGGVVAGEIGIYVNSVVDDPGSAVLFENTATGIIESGQPITVTGKATYCGAAYNGLVEFEQVPGLTITPSSFYAGPDGLVTFSVSAAYSGGFYIPVLTYGGSGGRSVAYVNFTHGDPLPPETPGTTDTGTPGTVDPQAADTNSLTSSDPSTTGTPAQSANTAATTTDTKTAEAVTTATTTKTTVKKTTSKVSLKFVYWGGKAKGKVKVTVKAGSKTPTGVVRIYHGKKVIAKATLKAKHKGKITLTLPAYKAGNYAIRVSYAGSSKIAASTKLYSVGLK